MIPTVGLLQLSLLAVVTLTLLGSATSGALYLALRNRLRRWAPAPRATALLLWAIAPALLGLLLTALCFLPSLLAVLGIGVGDHCVAHPDHHVHLCLQHPPREAGSPFGWVALFAVGSLAVFVFARHSLSLQRAHRSLKALVAGADLDGTRGIAWVRSGAPLALTIGMLKPRVVVTNALRRRLSRRQLRAVLEHEATHRRRRDVFRKTVASAFGLLHWSSVRRRLLDDLSLACEQTADAEAARRLRDPLLVADSILAVERIAGRHVHGAPAIVAPFGGSSVTARVEELLRPGAPVDPTRVRYLVVAFVGASLIVAEPLHHLVETLLTPLAR